MSSPAPRGEPHRIHFAWLIRLRWAATGGHLVTILVAAQGLRIRLPLAPLLGLVAVEAATNLGCALRLRSRRAIGERWLAGVMALDVLLLTGLLYLTGGPFNPFSFLYLVHLALATVVLSPRATWALLALSLASSAVLFVDHQPLRLPAALHDEHMATHLRGMWVALGVAAAFIVYFLLRVTRALAEREEELAAARHLAARQEKLASLATLAAGAAHELATPLGTILLAVRELERRLTMGGTGAASAASDDVRLIRQQVERCRGILVRMAADAGETAGEAPAEVTLRALLDTAQAEVASPPLRVEIEPLLEDRHVTVPPRAFAQALAALLHNAQHASPAGHPITLRALGEGEGALIEVEDTGTGMPPEVLSRVGEPFFTTRPPGRGMGLGVFLARAVAERCGGRISIASRDGHGTKVTLRLPLAPANIRRMGTPFPA